MSKYNNMTLADAAKASGIPYKTLYHRVIELGMTHSEAVSAGHPARRSGPKKTNKARMEREAAEVRLSRFYLTWATKPIK